MSQPYEKTVVASTRDIGSDVSDDTTPEKPISSWNVLVQGVALFSDGYNVQIIGYMETVMAKL